METRDRIYGLWCVWCTCSTIETLPLHMEFPTEKKEEKFCLARRTVAYLSCTFSQFCVPREKVAWFWRGGPPCMLLSLKNSYCQDRQM
jgi:hypothetical protein